MKGLNHWICAHLEKYPGEQLDTTLSFSSCLDRSYKWWVRSRLPAVCFSFDIQPKREWGETWRGRHEKKNTFFPTRPTPPSLAFFSTRLRSRRLNVRPSDPQRKNRLPAYQVRSFSNGDFKELAKPQSKGRAEEGPTEEAMPRGQEGGTFPYPQDGCVRLFQRLSNLERHLSFEKYTKSPERLSLMDLRKQFTHLSLMKAQ